MSDKFDHQDEEYEDDEEYEEEDSEDEEDGEWLTRRGFIRFLVGIICFTIIWVSEISEGGLRGCSIKSTPYEESSTYSAEKTLPGDLPWDCHCKDAGPVAACSCKMRSP